MPYCPLSNAGNLTVSSELITAYHELNPSTVDELDEEPSPLEFMRYVSRNVPFIVRKGAKDWRACQKWNADYLRRAMEGHSVNVATTPLGQVELLQSTRLDS